MISCGALDISRWPWRQPRSGTWNDAYYSSNPRFVLSSPITIPSHWMANNIFFVSLFANPLLSVLQHLSHFKCFLSLDFRCSVATKRAEWSSVCVCVRARGQRVSGTDPFAFLLAIVETMHHVYVLVQVVPEGMAACNDMADCILLRFVALLRRGVGDVYVFIILLGTLMVRLIMHMRLLIAQKGWKVVSGFVFLFVCKLQRRWTFATISEKFIRDAQVLNVWFFAESYTIKTNNQRITMAGVTSVLSFFCGGLEDLSKTTSWVNIMTRILGSLGTSLSKFKK